MAAVLLLALSMGLGVYAVCQTLPRHAARAAMIRRLGGRSSRHRPTSWLQARRRRALLTRAYPDLLAHLGAQTRAGAGALQAFATSPPLLREPLRSEVEEFVADLRVAPFPAALQRFAQRCGTPEIEAFAQSIIYQQSLGIAWAEALASEEQRALSLALQAVRQRSRRSTVAMATVTVILLLNGLLVYFTPVLYELSHTDPVGNRNQHGQPRTPSDR